MPKHTKLCHGDFNPTNVIVDDKGNWAVIDWAHAAQGGASADAAMTYLLFALEDQKLAQYVYQPVLQNSDTARQYVNRWLPIVAAAQLTKKKAKEKDFLMKWIDVLRIRIVVFWMSLPLIKSSWLPIPQPGAFYIFQNLLFCQSQSQYFRFIPPAEADSIIFKPIASVEKLCSNAEVVG